MDLPKGLHPVIRYNISWMTFSNCSGRLPRRALLRMNPGQTSRDYEESLVPRPTPANLVGLLFGGVVVVVMLFMKFVLLGNLFIPEQ